MSTLTCFADHRDHWTGQISPRAVVIDTTGIDPDKAWRDHVGDEHPRGTTGGLTGAQYDEWLRASGRLSD